MSEIYDNEYNKNRKEMSQTIIRRKIAELNRILQDPDSTDYYPDDAEAFRVWIDEAKGLERIGSTGTMNQKVSPHNRVLILQVKDCIQRLNKRRKNPRNKRPPLRDQLSVSQTTNRELTSLNRELVSQLHKLKFDFDVLSNSHRRMREKLPPPVSKIR